MDQALHDWARSMAFSIAVDRLYEEAGRIDADVRQRVVIGDQRSGMAVVVEQARPELLDRYLDCYRVGLNTPMHLQYFASVVRAIRGADCVKFVSVADGVAVG
jgi:hypothetical protein